MNNSLSTYTLCTMSRFIYFQKAYKLMINRNFVNVWDCNTRLCAYAFNSLILNKKSRFS